MPVFMEALQHLLTVIVQYMFVPYHVENWVMIFDVKEKFVLGFPKQVIQRAGNTIGEFFPGTLERVYMVNASKSLELLWMAIKPFANPFTVGKTVVLRPNEMARIHEKIPPENLEEKFGGTHPNTTQFWPPNKELFKSPVSLHELIQRDRTPFIYTYEHWSQITSCLSANKGENKPKTQWNFKEKIKEGIYAITKGFQTSQSQSKKTQDISPNKSKEDSPKPLTPPMETHQDAPGPDESHAPLNVYEIGTKLHLRMKN